MRLADERMETLEKKICIVSVGYSLPKECTADELERLFAQTEDCPDNNSVSAFFLKELLIDHLERIAKEASWKKQKINGVAQEGYFWELKATFYLYSEAQSLVQSVPDQCSVLEFKEEFKKKFREKGDDWGYGSNWSESIQRFVMKSLKEELERFVGDLSENGDVDSLTT